MRGDHLVATQLMMAQAIGALAEHIEGTTGFILTPITFAERPAAPAVGMTACFTDSTVATWGDVVAGGGTDAVLAWYNGTSWKVMAA